MSNEKLPTIWEIFKLWMLKKTCKHKWSVHDETRTFDSRCGGERPIKITQTIICSECGKIKKINI